jgi:UDP-arabinose 4-epimerase
MGHSKLDKLLADDKTRRVLVTGGAGYIGSHACKALARVGYEPVAYDNLVYGHRWAVKWGPFAEGDILDGDRLDQAFEEYRPDAVMHFAAFCYVGESMLEPAKYFRNNVVGTLSLLEAMRRGGIDKLIFSSTCATYGVPDIVPITEAHPQQPVNPYGASKLMVERMLKDYGAAYGMRSIMLRYFNAAGADPDAEIGEDHDPETHLIPLVLQAAAGDLQKVSVYGEDYPTPDGTCIRDYIHVTDLADAHVLALDALVQGVPTSAYNLGNGQGFSVKQVIESASRITGRRIEVEVAPRRPGDPPALVGDAAHIRRELGWHPRFPDLDAIIETAWRWHSKHRANPLPTA